MRLDTLAVCSGIALLAIGCSNNTDSADSKASASAVSRTVLVRQALSNVQDREGQIVQVVVAPGGSTGKHRHPVDEFVYILDGEGALHRQDADVLSVHPGQSLVLPSGQAHEMKNASTSAALKFLQFSVPAPGQPLAEPLP